MEYGIAESPGVQETGSNAVACKAGNKKPLIRYAGSAVETSIGSKPIGSELTTNYNASQVGVNPINSSCWAMSYPAHGNIAPSHMSTTQHFFDMKT